MDRAILLNTHSVLSPRNSFRNAGQRKSENQLSFCTTLDFAKKLIDPPVLELVLQQDSNSFKDIERQWLDRCSGATRQCDLCSNVQPIEELAFFCYEPIPNPDRIGVPAIWFCSCSCGRGFTMHLC